MVPGGGGLRFCPEPFCLALVVVLEPTVLLSGDPVQLGVGVIEGRRLGVVVSLPCLAMRLGCGRVGGGGALPVSLVRGSLCFRGGIDGCPTLVTGAFCGLPLQVFVDLLGVLEAAHMVVVVCAPPAEMIGPGAPLLGLDPQVVGCALDLCPVLGIRCPQVVGSALVLADGGALVQFGRSALAFAAFGHMDDLAAHRFVVALMMHGTSKV